MNLRRTVRLRMGTKPRTSPSQALRMQISKIPTTPLNLLLPLEERAVVVVAVVEVEAEAVVGVVAVVVEEEPLARFARRQLVLEVAGDEVVHAQLQLHCDEAGRGVKMRFGTVMVAAGLHRPSPSRNPSRIDKTNLRLCSRKWDRHSSLRLMCWLIRT